MDRSVDKEREKVSKKLKVPWADMDELRHDVLDEERFLMLKRLLVVQVTANAETFPRISLETLFSGYLIGRVYFDWPSQYVLHELCNNFAIKKNTMHLFFSFKKNKPMVAHGEEYWVVPKELVTALVDHQVSLTGERLPENPTTEEEKERVAKVRATAKKKFKTFLDARRMDQGAMAQVHCNNFV